MVGRLEAEGPRFAGTGEEGDSETLARPGTPVADGGRGGGRTEGADSRLCVDARSADRGLIFSGVASSGSLPRPGFAVGELVDGAAD